MSELRRLAQPLFDDPPLEPAPLSDLRRGSRRLRLRRVWSSAVVVVIATSLAVAVVVVRDDRRVAPAVATNAPVTSKQAAPPVGFLSIPLGSDNHALTVWGWNGRKISTFRTKSVVDCCTSVHISPDGTRILVDGSDDPAPVTLVLDLHGRTVASSPGFGGVWADDSRHMCGVTPLDPIGAGFDTEDPADFVISDPGRTTRVIASTLDYGPHSGVVILRCSIADDQAIIGETGTFGVDGIVAVQLSTGAVTTPKWFGARGTPAGSVFQSLVAISGNGRDAVETGGLVVDTRTGATVGHVDGQPSDISWDGHLVVTSLVASGAVEVVDWRSGRVVWRSAAHPFRGAATEAQVVARPYSDDLALTVDGVPGLPLQEAALWLITTSHPPLNLATTLV